MKRILIQNATIVNESHIWQGSLVIQDRFIAEVLTQGEQPALPCQETIDATGCLLIPGVIDDHVHFREPGLTDKAEIFTESAAAAAGGVTSIMDMPNTKPQTTTLEALDAKRELMSQRSIVNYSCYFGATNNNVNDLTKLDKHHVCGIKLFMGSSTGNMLVDREDSLRRIFDTADMLIAAHCEDQHIIHNNSIKYKAKYNNPLYTDVPIEIHPFIRSVEACFRSTHLAVKLATQYQARLHVLHLSTARELSLFTAGPVEEKHITAEACVAHLLYTQKDYRMLGTRIKCNPAVKRKPNRDALRQAVMDNRIDVIATDHAPHQLKDKQGGALTAASGIPMIQYSLISMLNLVDEGIFTIQQVVQKMCHAPATLFQIDRRGFIRPGYYADLTLVRHADSPWKIYPEQILSKCKWSPLEYGYQNWRVERTWVNGHQVWDGNQVDTACRGEELIFDR